MISWTTERINCCILHFTTILTLSLTPQQCRSVVVLWHFVWVVRSNDNISMNKNDEEDKESRVVHIKVNVYIHVFIKGITVWTEDERENTNNTNILNIYFIHPLRGVEFTTFTYLHFTIHYYKWRWLMLKMNEGLLTWSIISGYWVKKTWFTFYTDSRKEEVFYCRLILINRIVIYSKVSI